LCKERVDLVSLETTLPIRAVYDWGMNGFIEVDERSPQVNKANQQNPD